MSLFGKSEIKSLSSIKGVAAADVTADQIKAINEEFQALGFEGIEVAIAGTISSLQETAEANADAVKTAETLSADLKASQVQVEQLSADLAEATEKLGKPAAEAEEAQIQKDNIAAAGAEDENEADKRMTAKLKEKYGI